MANPFEGRSMPISGPARDIVPITPNDSVDLDDIPMALYVETGGALTVDTITGSSRVINVRDNSIIPVGIKRVYATGTDATGIHGLVI